MCGDDASPGHDLFWSKGADPGASPIFRNEHDNGQLSNKNARFDKTSWLECERLGGAWMNHQNDK